MAKDFAMVVDLTFPVSFMPLLKIISTEELNSKKDDENGRRTSLLERII